MYAMKFMLDSVQESFSMPSERRRAPRYQLLANAEVVELRSDAHFKVRTSDVSLFGCYMNSINWLPAGTEIRLRVTHKDTTFTALATVARSEAAMGMGVNFTVIALDQRAVLKNWLSDSPSRAGS
jgi:PilZ domain